MHIVTFADTKKREDRSCHYIPAGIETPGMRQEGILFQQYYIKNSITASLAATTENRSVFFFILPPAFSWKRGSQWQMDCESLSSVCQNLYLSGLESHFLEGHCASGLIPCQPCRHTMQTHAHKKNPAWKHFTMAECAWIVAGIGWWL